MIIIFTVSCFYIYKFRLDSSPILFRATTMIDFNADFFDFREDGSYKFTRWTFLGSDSYRGRYEIKDSIVWLLDSQNILSVKDVQLVLKTNRFVIRGDSTSQYLYQIDNDNQIIEKTDRYRILEFN